MGIFAIINLVVTMAPSILSLISQVEALFPSFGSGAQKKAVVMETVHTAALQAGHTANEVATILPVASQLVDTFVTVMNQHGSWNAANKVAEQVQGGISIAADAAKQIKAVADQVAAISAIPNNQSKSIGD